MRDDVDIILKEYKSIRNESLDSIKSRNKTVSYGLATLGILAGGTLSIARFSQADPLVEIIFCYGIPLVSCLILLIWLGEVERMMRAGNHLVRLESRINDLMGEDEGGLLTWETKLREEEEQLRYPYIATIALFLGIAVVSPLVGRKAVADPLSPLSLIFIISYSIILLTSFLIIYRTLKFR